jgi:hypothetical protein
VRHQRGLLVLALDGDETHVRPRHRLADRRRIRRVVWAITAVLKRLDSEPGAWSDFSD